MSQSQTALETVGNWFLVWAAVVGTASVFVHSRVPWWRSVMGRHLMAYMAAFAVVLDLGVVKLVTGDSPGFWALRVVVFASVPAVMTWRLWLQVKAQVDDRRAS